MFLILELFIVYLGFQVHTQNFSFGGVQAYPEDVYNLCLIFKNHVVSTT
jgi:hypothetical protein